MCALLTKSGPRGANAMGEQTWHVLSMHKYMLLGKNSVFITDYL